MVMCLSVPSRLSASLAAAASLLAVGCGQGLYDRLHVDRPDARDAQASETGADSGAANPAEPNAEVGRNPDLQPNPDRPNPDLQPNPDGPNPDTGGVTGPDADAAQSPDASPGATTITQTFGDTGGSLELGEAQLTMAPGSFAKGSSVAVTMTRIPAISRAGAVGPVFEISILRSGLFRQDPTLTVAIQPSVAAAAGNNLQALVLGAFDPNAALTDQHWVPVSGSTFNPNPPSVTGSVTGFGTAAVLQFAAVIKCSPGVTTCPSGQNCSIGGACNQCSASTECQ